MRSEIKIKCLGLPSSIYLIKSSICLWYFPKQKKRYFVYLGVGAHHHWWLVQGREATTQVSLSWSPQPSGPQLLTPHHINKLVSPTKRTTSHHTTPTHQDGARHCLPSDHLDRLGSFLGHRSQCCEWLKLLIPSLYGGQPLIKAQSKYSTFQFLCSEVEGTKK